MIVWAALIFQKLAKLCAECLHSGILIFWIIGGDEARQTGIGREGDTFLSCGASTKRRDQCQPQFCISHQSLCFIEITF